VLQDFSSLNIPLNYLVGDLIRPIQPRSFSVSSALRVHHSKIHIAVAIVAYRTKMKIPRTGVCTTWLASLRPEQNVRIPIWIEKGTMDLPQDEKTPMILIGPGTGCAPFRSFIYHRFYQYLNIDINSLNRNQVPPPLKGETHFFFGCRFRDHDYLYGNEFENLQDQVKILNQQFHHRVDQDNSFNYHVAFSRDQEEKVYVQHKLGQNGKLIWEAIQKGAIIYLSGNAKRMPQDVSEELEKIVEKNSGLDPAQAKEFIKNLEKNRRFQIETWS